MKKTIAGLLLALLLSVNCAWAAEMTDACIIKFMLEDLPRIVKKEAMHGGGSVGTPEVQGACRALTAMLPLKFGELSLNFNTLVQGKQSFSISRGINYASMCGNFYKQFYKPEITVDDIAVFVLIMRSYVDNKYADYGLEDWESKGIPDDALINCHYAYRPDGTYLIWMISELLATKNEDLANVKFWHRLKLEMIADFMSGRDIKKYTYVSSAVKGGHLSLGTMLWMMAMRESVACK